MHKPEAPSKTFEDLEKRVIDLLNGKGSEFSRRLTLEMLRAFPSLVSSLSNEHQEKLQGILD
jgi:hypothetical protein